MFGNSAVLEARISALEYKLGNEVLYIKQTQNNFAKKMIEELSNASKFTEALLKTLKIKLVFKPATTTEASFELVKEKS